MVLTTLRQQWAERIAAFQASGQSAPDWCAQHQINLRQLHYWKRKFAADAADAAASSPPQWVSLSITPPAPDPSLSVRIGAAVIAVAPGFNAALLRDIVDALGGR